MNKHQENAFNIIKRKFNFDAIETDIMEVIYDFITVEGHEHWNLRNAYLVGFGECLNSNNDLTDEERERFKDFWASYNLIILQHKETKEYVCLMLPPGAEYNVPTNQTMAQYPLSAFDNIQQCDDGNWIIENDFDDQIQIAPYTFDSSFELTDIISPILLKFNDLLCEKMATGNTPLLSDVITEAYN